MEDCMREFARKLALWYTPTFKPILTHEELESILATKGFIGLPPFSFAVVGKSNLLWKEYVYSGAGMKSVVAFPDTAAAETETLLPRPRFPFNRIDGLHVCTYLAFVDAVNFYLEMEDISTLFHIRGLPLHRIYDRSMRWIPIEEDEYTLVYRDGTLDPTTNSFCNSNKKKLGYVKKNSMAIRDPDKKILDSDIVMVSLKDFSVVRLN